MTSEINPCESAGVIATSCYLIQQLRHLVDDGNHDCHRPPSNLSGLSPSGTVQVATGVSPNNAANWNPTITVTISPGSLAGTYSTTITHSVISCGDHDHRAAQAGT
jgi:hypothetical protein